MFHCFLVFFVNVYQRVGLLSKTKHGCVGTSTSGLEWWIWHWPGDAGNSQRLSPGFNTCFFLVLYHNIPYYINIYIIFIPYIIYIYIVMCIYIYICICIYIILYIHRIYIYMYVYIHIWSPFLGELDLIRICPFVWPIWISWVCFSSHALTFGKRGRGRPGRKKAYSQWCGTQGAVSNDEKYEALWIHGHCLRRYLAP